MLLVTTSYREPISGSFRSDYLLSGLWLMFESHWLVFVLTLNCFLVPLLLLNDGLPLTVTGDQVSGKPWETVYFYAWVGRWQ